MVQVTIIYTPEAFDFIPHEMPTLADRTPGNPKLQELRERYASLQNKYGGLPSQVGVVTFPGPFKRMTEGWRKELADSKLVNVTTTYTPLNLLDECVAIKHTSNGPLEEHFAYRMLMYVLSNPALTLDDTFTTKQRMAVMGGSVIPTSENTMNIIKRTRDQMKSEGVLHAKLLDRAIELIQEAYPLWQDLEQLHDYVSQRFEANRVSRDFPLYFFPPGRAPVRLFSVDLKDEIFVPPVNKNILEYIRIGSKAEGYDDIPPEIMDALTIGKRDLFAETEEVYTLDKLLDKLPSPHTIITDIYFVDHFPQIKDREYKTFELK